MPNASANRADLRYFPEVTWGVTPGTPAMKLLRMTGESMTAQIQTEVSAEIRDDRNVSDLIQVGSNAGGNVEFELSYASFDDWLEAVMCSTWTVGTGDTFTMVNGQTERSFSVQKRLLDVAQFFHFVGTRINTMNLAIAPNKIVTGSFGAISKTGVRSATQFTGATYPAGSTTVPMNGAAGVTLNQVDAGVITGGLMNFSLAVTNNMRAQDAIGSLGAQAIVNGRFEVTGDFEVYFADGTLYDKFQAMTPFAIKVEMTEPNIANKITIDVPKAKFETAEVVAQGTDTDVMLKTKYRGIYDTVTLGSLKLTKDGPA
jgi:hypothetical protein